MRSRAPKIRKCYTFYGRVQAVGFRWRAQHAANLYGVTGWVGNNPFGSVSMEIQGTQEQIDQVIRVLNSDDYIRIDHMEIRETPPEPEERSFRVAY